MDSTRSSPLTNPTPNRNINPTQLLETMPIQMPRDTRTALGAGAAKCQSRSLLHQKLVFFDADLKGCSRFALDLVVTDGHVDIQRMANEAQRLVNNQRTGPATRQSNQAILNKIATIRTRQDANLTHSAQMGWLPPKRHLAFELVTAERLALGLANGVIENCGIYIHRFFGFPYIPGSSLKGIALDAAPHCGVDADQQRLLFGNPHGDKDSRQGLLRFLDATPTDPACRILLDISTPHYPDYYSNTSNPNALDNESPNPIPFPVVAEDQEFRFVILIDSVRPMPKGMTQDQVLELGRKCLEYALCHHGVGAKSATGFGRFRPVNSQPFIPPAKDSDFFGDFAGKDGEGAAAAALPANPVDRMIAELTKVAASSFNILQYINEMMTLESDDDLKRVAEAVIPEKNWKSINKFNPLWESVLKCPQGMQFLRRLGKEVRP